MFGSEILELFIGLVFLYLSASLICSGIMELIAKLLKLRAKHLKEELAVLLKSKELVNVIYKNPLVKDISRGFITIKEKNGTTAPANIPTHNFITALIDTLLDIKKDSKEFSALEENIKKIDNAEIKEILLKALNGARTKAGNWERWLEASVESISKWFDNSMEKLSLWYKKQSRIIIFVIGILVTLVLNLDSLMIVKSLYQNETLRSTVTMAVEKTDLSTLQPKNAAEIQKTLVQMGFPIGWDLEKPQNKDPRGYPVGQEAIIYKIIGLLLTLMAISMGATFWFDILRKLLSFRKAINQSKEDDENMKKSN